MNKERTLNEYRQTKEYKTPVPEIDKPSAEAFLGECEYVTQDGDTVYIDEEVIHETMEQYARQFAINEIYEALCDNPSDMVTHLKKIIEDLKQD